MVRNPDHDVDEARVGRPEKHARSTRGEREFEDVPAEEKPLALSEMQHRIEAGEDEERALREAVDDVESDAPRVGRDLERARREGRPEGEG